MNRRDAIIVAVLINTGLLAALFLLAIHNPEPTQEVSAEIAYKNALPQEVGYDSNAYSSVPPAPSPVRDPYDEAIKNYALTPSAPVSAVPSSESKIPEPQLHTSSVSEYTPRYHPQAIQEKPEEHFVEVTVKRGDYLDKIARVNGTTVRAIMQANNLTSPRIDIGQVLRIPVGKSKETEPVKTQIAVAKKQESEPLYYTMKSGDNPWKIAKEFHVRFDELLKLNDLDEEKARNLKPGVTLRVR